MPTSWFYKDILDQITKFSSWSFRLVYLSIGNIFNIATKRCSQEKGRANLHQNSLQDWLLKAELVMGRNHKSYNGPNFLTFKFGTCLCVEWMIAAVARVSALQDEVTHKKSFFLWPWKSIKFAQIFHQT
jgi:hypothetical protein